MTIHKKLIEEMLANANVCFSVHALSTPNGHVVGSFNGSYLEAGVAKDHLPNHLVHKVDRQIKINRFLVDKQILPETHQS